MNCAKCNTEIPEGSAACPQCGEPQPATGDAQNVQPPPPTTEPQQSPEPQQQSTKSRTIYILLAFFFGVFGVHNFYAGRIVPGIIQLGITLLSLLIGLLTFILFFGLGGVGVAVPLVWALVDMLFVKKDGAGLPMKRAAKAVFILPGLEIAIPVGVILAFVAILVVGEIGHRKLEECKQNMTEISKSVVKIRKTSDSEYRETYRPSYADNAPSFRCPETGKKYVILGTGMEVGSHFSEIPSIIECSPFHGNLAHVAFLDGHVEAVRVNSGMSTEDVVKYLLNKAGRSMRYKGYTWEKIRARWLEDARKAD